MGSLSRFDLSRYREHYGLGAFFETGTCWGDGVQYAVDAGFERIFSVEIMDEFFDASSERFKDLDHITLIKGESVTALEQTLPDIEDNILFWLDAHFPGADGGLKDYNAPTDETIRCPLETELEVIQKHRAGREDVFVIDDLRIYEQGPFKSGNLPEYIERPPNASIDFVFRLFSESHHIVRLYDDEGYVLMVPLSSMPKLYITRKISDIRGDLDPVFTGG